MTHPLVFLPGWCLGRGPLNAAVNTLHGQIIDLPGYGSTPLIEDFATAADHIAGQMQDGSVLCGWSLGAQLAIAIAASAPEKVSKLVLVAGTTSFVQRPDWPHAMSPEMLAEFTTGVLADIESMLPRFVGGFNRGDARNKAVTRELLELADPRPSIASLACGLNWLRDVDLRACATKVSAPTLLMHGSADPLMPLAAAEALATLIPHARLEVFDECAHAPFISRPDDFIARLLAFLNESTV